jgi:sialidase-1
VGVLLVTFSCQKSGGATDDPGSSQGDTTDNAPPPVKTLHYIYKAGTEGYSCFRIPAIIKTKKGTLLAFAEARKNNCGDAGNIDLVVRRSLDNGKTWSGLITVWDDGGNTCGNPAPVIDEKTGNVILAMSWNLGKDNIGEINNGTSEDTRRVYVTHSADDGLSWAIPKEVTDSVKPKNWGWYATGPCHGIQIAGGKHAGRLMIPCDHIALVTKKGSSHIIYSDDGGSTWHLGGVVPGGGNESSVAELSNGDLMINMRSKGLRLISTSKDGGISWSTAKKDSHLPDPACQGSLLSYPAGLSHELFFSNPSSGNVRSNMTIKESFDDGVTWSKSLQVHEGPSAYSDLVMIDATHVGILYEGGSSSPYEGIVFENVPVNEIK